MKSPNSKDALSSLEENIDSLNEQASESLNKMIGFNNNIF
jgi:hypothetical protein